MLNLQLWKEKIFLAAKMSMYKKLPFFFYYYNNFTAFTKKLIVNCTCLVQLLKLFLGLFR